MKDPSNFLNWVSGVVKASQEASLRKLSRPSPEGQPKPSSEGQSPELTSCGLGQPLISSSGDSRGLCESNKKEAGGEGPLNRSEKDPSGGLGPNGGGEGAPKSDLQEVKVEPKVKDALNSDNPDGGGPGIDYQSQGQQEAGIDTASNEITNNSTSLSAAPSVVDNSSKDPLTTNHNLNEMPNIDQVPAKEGFFTKIHNWITGRNLPAQDPSNDFFSFNLDGPMGLNVTGTEATDKKFKNIMEFIEYYGLDKGPKDPNFELYTTFFSDPKNLILPLTPQDGEFPGTCDPQNFSIIPYESTPPGPGNSPSGDWLVSAVQPETSQLGGLDQKTFGRWEIDSTILEDPHGFYRDILPNLKVLTFRERVFFTGDITPFKYGVHGWPDCGLDARMYIRNILYLEGPDKRYWSLDPGYFEGEYDYRINKDYLENVYFKQIYSDVSDPFRFKNSYTWKECGFRKWEGHWMPDYRGWYEFTNASKVYRNTKYHYPFDDFNELEKIFIKPLRDAEFHSYWILFRDPLKSLNPGGPSICGIQVNSLPPELSVEKETGMWPGHRFNPRLHPDFNPRTGYFTDTHIFGRGVWHRPEWGSRYSNTELGGLLTHVERWVKLIGNYISKRTGQDMPFWASKDFFMRNLGWVRNHPDVVTNKYGGRVGPHFFDALINLRMRFFSNLLTSLKEREAIWYVIRLFGETTSTLLVVATLVLILFTFLYKKVCGLGAFNGGIFIFLSKIKKIIYLLAIAFKKSLTLLIRIYLTVLVIFTDFALIAIETLSTSNLFTCWLWSFVGVCCYTWLSFKLHSWRYGEGKKDLEPFDFYLIDPPEPIIRKRQFLAAAAPFLINIVLGETPLLSIATQRWVSIVLILCYLTYLAMLVVYLLTIWIFRIDYSNNTIKKIETFIERYLPSFIRAEAFIKKKLKRRGIPTQTCGVHLPNKFGLKTLYWLGSYFRVWVWRILFLVSALILLVLTIILISLLSINIEGALGITWGLSWATWFLTFSILR